MFLISAIVKGIIWGAAAVEPIIQMLGLGSIFAAWNMAKQPQFSNVNDDPWAIDMKEWEAQEKKGRKPFKVEFDEKEKEFIEE